MTLSLRPSSLTDSLYDALRQRILEGEIPPASRLTEIGIANEYGVSRPTAKAALERLVHHGMLRRGANKTAQVPTLSAAEIRDIYFSRICLERQIVAELASGGTVPSDVETAMRQFRATARGGESILVLVQLDVTFHRALTAALDSPRLTRMHDAVMGEAHLCMAQVQIHKLLNPTVMSREHAAILQSIRDGDSERAADQLAKHLVRARDALAGYVDTRDSEAAD